MSTFSISQTGTEINSAIGKVHNADTSPTQGSTNMVTSGGVYTAVNNVDVSALPITTEAEGIVNYDNDNNVPTNAAVKDYVENNTYKMGGLNTLFTGSSGSTTTHSGTATQDMFIIAQGYYEYASGRPSVAARECIVNITVAGTQVVRLFGHGVHLNGSAWVKKGESYSVTVSNSRLGTGKAYYRSFS